MWENFESKDLNPNCFDKLQRDILDGIYIPGEKLSMAKLKKALKTGQSPIREALSRLLAQGLVEQEENKGFRVTRISEKDLRDLYQTIAQIENIAIRQSIQLGDDKWEVNLVAMFHQLVINETNKNSADYLAKCYYSFIKALIFGCNSSALINIHNNLFLKFELYVKLALKYNPSLIETCFQRKKLLLEAALRRDVEETLRIFTKNTEVVFDEVIKSLKNVNFFN